MSTQVRAWLDNAILQSVAECYLHMLPQFGGNRSIDDVLIAGVNNLDLNPQGNGATRLTETQIVWFKANYDIITHYPDDSTGFSATLFRNKATGEYTLSFRSTEYQLQAKGGDWECDGQSGADGSIKETGLAFAQLAAMEEFYNHLKNGQVRNASGQWVADANAQAFADEQNCGAKLNVTGYSLGAHLATAFTLEHWGDVDKTYTYNAAGVGVSGDHAAVGARIAGLIELYNNMMAWNGQGKPSWIPSWAYYNGDTGGYFTGAWSAYAAAAQAEPAKPTVPNIYADAKYQAAIAALKSVPYTTSGVASGTADTLFALQNWASTSGDGPLARDQNAFESNLHVVSDWNQKITQLYGHGEFFDPQIVANSLYHATPTSIWTEDLPVSRGSGFLELFSASQQFRDIVGDYGETHSITVLIDSLTVLDLIQGIDPSFDMARFRQLMKDMAHSVHATADGFDQKAVDAFNVSLSSFSGAAETYMMLSALWANFVTGGEVNLYDAEALENLVNKLATLFLGADPNLAPAKNSGTDEYSVLGYADINARTRLHATITLIQQSAGYQLAEQNAGLTSGFASLVSMTRQDILAKARQDNAEGIEPKVPESNCLRTPRERPTGTTTARPNGIGFIGEADCDEIRKKFDSGTFSVFL